MNKIAIEDIKNFIENEIREYSIEYDFEIEDDSMVVIFNNLFGKGSPEMTFRWVSGNVEFYALSDSWIDAETRQFWIDLLFKLLD